MADELKKAFAERALNADTDHHVETGAEECNWRNGYGKKKVLTRTGKLGLEVRGIGCRASIRS